eukprot:4839739-Prymnesium_polylepis.1
MNFLERHMLRNDMIPGECNFPSSAWVISIAFMLKGHVTVEGIAKDFLRILSPFVRFRNAPPHDACDAAPVPFATALRTSANHAHRT